MKLDFRFHFTLVIHPGFNIERSEDGRNPQENGAAHKVSSGADPAGGTENPILRILHRLIELSIFQESFRVEYIGFREHYRIVEDDPEILHDYRAFWQVISLVGVVFLQQLGDADR